MEAGERITVAHLSEEARWAEDVKFQYQHHGNVLRMARAAQTLGAEEISALLRARNAQVCRLQPFAFPNKVAAPFLFVAPRERAL